MVSEFMLQQTQTARVMPKYEAWVNQFPDPESVAVASKTEILQAWQGLGYNRRALYLHRACVTIYRHYQNIVPQDKNGLLNLPGIGDYTASAIRTFAWNYPEIMLETNIRTALLYHFYDYENLDHKVSDKSLHDQLARVLDTLQIDDYRDFYYRLMDYGVLIKKTVGNLNTLTATYAKQSRFEGSTRQVRAAIVRHLLQTITPVNYTNILENISINLDRDVDPSELQQLLDDLVSEGMIAANKKGRYTVS